MSAKPDRESAREFLKEYIAEVDPSDLVNNIELCVMVNAGRVLPGLKSLETVLALPDQDETLLQLVLHDAAFRLEPPTAESARRWLEWLVQQFRREIRENLLPFQPIRARLERVLPPDDKRFPHDLRLYPTDDPLPEYRNTVWDKRNIFYAAFLKEWDGKTCPACQVPTIRHDTERKRNDIFIIYHCGQCHGGWTESTDP